MLKFLCRAQNAFLKESQLKNKESEKVCDKEMPNHLKKNTNQIILEMIASRLLVNKRESEHATDVKITLTVPFEMICSEESGRAVVHEFGPEGSL